MNADKDPEFGALLFEDAIMHDSFSNDSITLYAQGMYLMNGGDPDRFMDFTDDDIQILVTTMTCRDAKQREETAKILKSMYGGSVNG